MGNFLETVYNKTTYYPDKVLNYIFRPLSEESFEKANKADLFSATWFSKRIQIGVQSAILLIPVGMAINNIAVNWGLILSPEKVIHSFEAVQVLDNPSHLMIFYICILGPLEEEIACRGIIQPTIRWSLRKFLDAKKEEKSPLDLENGMTAQKKAIGLERERIAQKVAIVLTAVLFGCLHGNLMQGVSATFGGLYLGYLRERTDSTVTSTAAHITHNSMTTLLPIILGTVIRGLRR